LNINAPGMSPTIEGRMMYFGNYPLYFLFCLIVPQPAFVAPQQSSWHGKTAEQWIVQLSDKDVRERWYATHALGEMASAKPKVPIPFSLARKMGPSSSPATAVGPLMKILENPRENEYVRGGAAWALGRMHEAAAPAVPLLSGLFDSKHVSVRRNSALALGNVGRAAKSAVPVLLKALADKDPTVRVNAAVALWKIDRHAEAVPALVKMLRTDTEPGAFEAAVALGELRPDDKSAEEALTEALQSPDADVRRAAARSLSQAKEPKGRS
jgi:HEAT repeat protein